MEDSAGYERRAYQRNGSERGHLITSFRGPLLPK